MTESEELDEDLCLLPVDRCDACGRLLGCQEERVIYAAASEPGVCCFGCWYGDGGSP